MEWREVGPYRDAVIWVRELREGCWAAAVALVPALAAPSEEMVLPAGFASEWAAVEAAQRHIDHERERPARQERRSGEEAGTRRSAPVPDLRRFARFPVSLPVLVRADQFPGQEIAGSVRNIGAGGLMAELPVHMQAGSDMDLFLQTRWGPREMEARVVWTDASGDTVRHGCSFTTPQGPDFAADLFILQLG